MEENERIPISSIKQYIYCKRRFALMFIDREWESNYKIVEGDILHEKVDDPFIKESRGDLFRSRSVPVYSDNLNIQGVCDLIEFIKSSDGVKVGRKKGLWSINPIDYKNGKPEKSDADNFQLCAIAICLEEMFNTHISSGDLYYGKLRRRVKVQFTKELREKVESAIHGISELLREQSVPQKAEDQNCSMCSLLNICLPGLFDRHTSIRKAVNKLMK
jgi:CRISPR-associated exonuclease Cas4